MFSLSFFLSLAFSFFSLFYFSLPPSYLTSFSPTFSLLLLLLPSRLLLLSLSLSLSLYFSIPPSSFPTSLLSSHLLSPPPPSLSHQPSSLPSSPTHQVDNDKGLFSSEPLNAVSSQPLSFSPISTVSLFRSTAL